MKIKKIGCWNKSDKYRFGWTGGTKKEFEILVKDLGFSEYKIKSVHNWYNWNFILQCDDETQKVFHTMVMWHRGLLCAEHGNKLDYTQSRYEDGLCFREDCIN